MNDEAALLLIAKFNADLELRGELPNDRAAAHYVVKRALSENPPWTMPVGNSPAAVEERLRKKYRLRRGELAAIVAVAAQK